MTLREQIEAASAKATQGDWRIRVGPRDDQDTCDLAICGDIFVLADFNGPQYPHQHPNAAFIVALVNAYRAGKLLVIEDEADAVRRMRNGMRNAVLSLDAIASLEAATAALAALKGDSA